MGHKISKEQIDPGVKDHIMSFVGDITELETDEKSDIISAVNSLMVDRVDNAENMGKLANAIGEPVTANHSVDEVVEGLGEMLSTFKTNMMNSGVMVESSDKFKQLIDKIKGLTEGEGNKGIQFAEGTVNFNSITTGNANKVYMNLNFTPTYVIGVIDHFTVGQTGDSVNMVMGNFGTSGHQYAERAVINNVSSSEFDFTVQYGIEYTTSNVTVTWYAIGVGEEDTTLRDSLASILQEEGVSVSEEDDMASLISKVDEEFNNKTQQIIDIMNDKGLNIDGDSSFNEVIDAITAMPAVGELDIVVATELPEKVIENKIVIISDVNTDNFAFCSVNPVIGTDVNEGDIAIQYLGTDDALNIYYEAVRGISFYMAYCYQVVNGVLVERDLYYGENGNWVKLEHTVCMMNSSRGRYADESTNFELYTYLGPLPPYYSDGEVTYTYSKDADGYVTESLKNADGNVEVTIEPLSYRWKRDYMDYEGYISSTNGYSEAYSYMCIYTPVAVDLTGIKTLKVNISATTSITENWVADTSRNNGKSSLSFGLVDASITGVPSTDDLIVKFTSPTDKATTYDGVITLDVSEYNGLYKLLVHYGTNHRRGSTGNPKTIIIRSIEVTR